jgi:hypothetical protein
MCISGDFHMFQASYLISTLEHARRLWGISFLTSLTERGGVTHLRSLLALLHSCTFALILHASSQLPLTAPLASIPSSSPISTTR